MSELGITATLRNSKIVELKPANELQVSNLAAHLKKCQPDFIDFSFFNKPENKWETIMLTVADLIELGKKLK